MSSFRVKVFYYLFFFSFVSCSIGTYQNIFETVVIEFPCNAATFEAEELITLRANRYVTWISNKDDVLGKGKSISVYLASGSHEITARTENGNYASISVYIREPQFIPGSWVYLRPSVVPTRLSLASGHFYPVSVTSENSISVETSFVSGSSRNMSFLNGLGNVGLEESFPFIRDVTFELSSQILHQNVSNLSLTRQKKSFSLKPVVGDTGIFRVADPSRGTGEPGWIVNARCAFIAENVSLWIDTETNVDETLFQDFTEKLNRIVIPRVQTIWGYHYDLDNDGMFTVLMTKKLNDQQLAIGFFNPCDYFPYSDDPASNQYNPTSNMKDILYIGAIAPDSNKNYNRFALLATIAHEYQHLCRFSRKTFYRLVHGDPNPPLEDSAFDEAMSHLTESLVGYGLSGGNLSFVQYYFQRTDAFSLLGQDENGATDSAGKRGMGSLFLYYLLERKGGIEYGTSGPSELQDKGGMSFLKGSIDYPASGWKYLEAVFQKDLSVLLTEFSQYIQQSCVAQQPIPGPIDPFTGEPLAIYPYMGTIVSPHDSSLKVNLIGPQLVPLKNYLNFLGYSICFFEDMSFLSPITFSAQKRSGKGQTVFLFYMTE